MRNKNMGLLLAGRTVSQFGAGFYLIALPLEMLARTDSLTQSGLFFTLAAMPSVLLSPVLGVMVERLRRRTVIVGSDIVSGLIYAALLLSGNTYGLLIGTMLLHILSSAFEIASKVAVSELVPKQDLQRYNGLQAFCDNLASIAAPVAGAAVYGAFGFHTVLSAAAIAYTLSGLQELLIAFPARQTETARQRHGALAQMREGLRFVAEKKDVRGLFLVVMALNFFVANSEEVIYPGMLTQKYGISGSAYGTAMAMFVVGSLAASLLIFCNRKIQLGDKMRPLIVACSVVMGMMGVCSLAMTQAPKMFYCVFLILALAAGGMNACVNVPLRSHFQMAVPVAMQGRFFSLMSFCSQLLVPVGISAAGVLADAVGADAAYIINNGMAILVAVFALKRYA